MLRVWGVGCWVLGVGCGMCVSLFEDPFGGEKYPYKRKKEHDNPIESKAFCRSQLVLTSMKTVHQRIFHGVETC